MLFHIFSWCCWKNASPISSRVFALQLHYLLVCNSAVRNAWSATIENQVTRTLKSLTKKSRWCVPFHLTKFQVDLLVTAESRCVAANRESLRGGKGGRGPPIFRTTKTSSLSSSIKDCINFSWRCPFALQANQWFFTYLAHLFLIACEPPDSK